jgi:hypothetical protein
MQVLAWKAHQIQIQNRMREPKAVKESMGKPGMQQWSKVLMHRRRGIHQQSSSKVDLNQKLVPWWKAVESW